MEEKKEHQEQDLPVEPKKPEVIGFENADVSIRYSDVYQDISPDVCKEVRWQDDSYEFDCENGTALRIQVVSPNIVRFRYALEGQFERDFSYALDPDFEPKKVKVTLTETDTEYQLATDLLQIIVSKKKLLVRIYNSEDQLICEDKSPFQARRTVLKGLSELRLRKKCHRGESFWGLGDKTGPSNLRGARYENWCTDAFGYGSETDPLYRSVPFYYSMKEGLAYGIFLDNTFRSFFDFDSEKKGYTEISCSGGEFNYYFIYGPEALEVSCGYAQLTGSHALPPVWALGYHQCKWSYFPDTRVLEIANKFRELEMPCDAIYLDIDYMDGFRCFTWDKEHFPDPDQLIADLNEQGFKTVVMIDPGIKEDPNYEVYTEGLEKDVFVRTADGPVAKAPVWPGFCAFPDFTNPTVRTWWGRLYSDLYKTNGVAGFWNDMNEPAVFHVDHMTLPDSVLHNQDGEICGHARAHNIYGMQMTRASWEGLLKLKRSQRPFLLTRANFAGGQRYGAVWTGDNLATWEHLQIAIRQCVRLSISGFSFCGTDIGGFSGAPDGELFVRWLQLGVFHPLMRVHSMGTHLAGDQAIKDEAELASPEMHKKDQEPWSFGEKWTSLAKKAIELRYSILPCLYTAMWKHASDGTPVLRPLIFEDPLDSKCLENEREFMFGEHLLVSPVDQPKAQRQMVPLPKGNWYYFWTGHMHNGEQFVNVMPDQIPFFVREGAVVPIYPIRQWTGEKKVDELSLYVYYKNGEEVSHLYEDQGEGMQYKDGKFCLQEFSVKGSESSLELIRSKSGELEPEYETVKIYLVGFPVFVKGCTVDGEEMPIKEIRLRDRSLYTMNISADFTTIVWNG